MNSFLLLLLSPLLFLSETECPTRTASNASEYNSLKAFMPSLLHRKMFNSKNGLLTIRLSPNKSVKFVDAFANTDDTNSKKYSFLGYIDVLNGFIVQENGYELSSIIMVTKNGNKLSLWSIPYASSDGRIIVCFSQGIETDLVPNGLQVLQMKNGEVLKSCKIYLKYYEPQSLRWLDNASFVLKSQAVGSNGLKINKYKYDKFIFK